MTEKLWNEISEKNSKKGGANKLGTPVMQGIVLEEKKEGNNNKNANNNASTNKKQNTMKPRLFEKYSKEYFVSFQLKFNLKFILFILFFSISAFSKLNRMQYI